jgi:ribonuclease E
MPKVMLINVTHPEESRVAIIKDGVLEAFEIESLSREQLKGNIYKGVVHRIHPALEAAFVDIGGARDAFLPLDEVCFRNLPRAPAPGNNDGGSKNGRRRRRIRDLLRTGEELLVQITKEAHGTKPATVTTFYSLPGRYLVLLPGSEEAGISRRIEGDERIRLRKLVSELQPPEGFGLIVRTAAGFDENDAEFERDLSYLCRLWSNVEQAAAQQRAPALLYREHDIVLRTIRDYFAPDIDEIHIDNEEVYERARAFLRDLMPGHEQVLHLYEGAQPIFSAFDVEAQFESIFKRRVELPSGGSIVIDPTEALTAIDVNSGGSVRGPNPEETAFRTNLEAATESCRQMRLRDIGGLVVIDFIDMREPGHIHEVEQKVREAMRPDRARHEVGRISRFGLMEISRQRLRPTAMATTYTTCAMCEGHGAVRTTESAALVALRKSHNRIAQGDVSRLRVTLPNEVALYVLNQKRDALAELEARYDAHIQVCLSDDLMPHQVEMDVVGRPPARKKPEPPSPGTVAAAHHEASVEETTPGGQESEAAAKVTSSAGNGNGNDRKRRRRPRRRRGRGGLKAAIALGEALAGLGFVAEPTVSPPGEGGLEEAPEPEQRPVPEEVPTEQVPRVEEALPAVAVAESVEESVEEAVEEVAAVPQGSEPAAAAVPMAAAEMEAAAAPEVAPVAEPMAGGESVTESVVPQSTRRAARRTPPRTRRGPAQRRVARKAVVDSAASQEAATTVAANVEVEEAQSTRKTVSPVQASDAIGDSAWRPSKGKAVPVRKRPETGKAAGRKKAHENETPEGGKRAAKSVTKTTRVRRTPARRRLASATAKATGAQSEPTVSGKEKARRRKGEDTPGAGNEGSLA